MSKSSSHDPNRSTSVIKEPVSYNDSLVILNHHLLNEYKIYSQWLYQLENHILDHMNQYVIPTKEGNMYLRQINDMVILINKKYNEILTSNDPQLLEEFNKYQNVTPTTIIEYINLQKIMGKKTIQYFDEIDKKLKELGKFTGFTDLDTTLDIVICKTHKMMFQKETIDTLQFYNIILKPISYSLQKNKSKSNIIVKRKISDNPVLIRPLIELWVKIIDVNYVVITGIVKTDPINSIIRTSQLCYPFLFQKKKEIESLKYTDINNQFVKSYIRSISLCDLLTLETSEIYKNIHDDYKMYLNMIRVPFVKLLSEFTNMTPSLNSNNDHKINTEQTNNFDIKQIRSMYNMMRILLIGSEESINVAGLLYGILKDKKLDTQISIASLIYQNLNYLTQIKLRKSSINFKTEIENIKSTSSEDIDLKKQVTICRNMPLYVKKIAFEKIDEMKLGNNEYYKQLLYVKTLLNYPWPSETDTMHLISKNGEIASQSNAKSILDALMTDLDNQVYGHKECKESISELVGKWITNPSSAGSVVGLSGPPGVGKTLIAKAIGKALCIPFVQITLGGQNDGELLHGHGYTYSGAQPGMIVKKMVEAGSPRCIMYFDELDKACKKYDGNEIYNILIHLTDPNTNTEFQDRFFQEIKFPLDKVLFIFSYNDPDKIDNILMDRIKQIEVKSFKLNDKINIVNKFLTKEMSELIDIKNIKVEQNAIELIINQYTHESGVRDLKRKLETIFLKLNIDRIYGKINDFTINKEMVTKYLGSDIVKTQMIHDHDLSGVINGLYATDSGQGGILSIQIYENYAKHNEQFVLKLTGSQRRVMRESVTSAFTAAMHFIEPTIRTEYIKCHPSGFHIHTPSGAVPKDGPSAGSAFAIGFVSRILNKKIKKDIAITGEIELTGSITKIGGLQYKLQGAKRAGVKTVFVSKENEEDIIQIKKDYIDLIDDNFNVVLVSNLSDVIPLVLI